MHVVLRRIREICSTNSAGLNESSMIELVYIHLAPAVLPGGILAKAISDGINSSAKPVHVRTAEALQSLGKLVDTVPPPKASASNPTNMLVPFFLDTIASGLSSKGSLTIINILLPYIPLAEVPEVLLERLVKEMYAIDLGNLRGPIISQLIIRNLEEAANAEKEQRILGSLFPLFSPTAPATTMTNVHRYLLPPLFAARPSIIHSLLLMLGGGESGRSADYFAAWTSVASLGVSVGHITVTELPEQDVQNAMVHSDPDVRLKAFQLITGSKDLLDERTETLVRKSLLWNRVLPDSG
jgi:hypothetical protein